MKLFHCPKGPFSVTILLDFDELQNINQSLNDLQKHVNYAHMSYDQREFITMINLAIEKMEQEQEAIELAEAPNYNEDEDEEEF